MNLAARQEIAYGLVVDDRAHFAHYLHFESAVVLGQQSLHVLHNKVFRAQGADDFQVVIEKPVALVKPLAPPGETERLAAGAARHNVHFLAVQLLQ